MPEVKIFWDPSGLELDALGKKRYLRATDGDTPYVSMSIRMLGIDTPEVHCPGNQKPSKHDARLGQLADWIQAGRSPVSSGLAGRLHPKLATGVAGTLQQEQGESATTKFKELLEEKLMLPSGRRRRVFLRATDQHFDQYGRLLAYMAPYLQRRGKGPDVSQGPGDIQPTAGRVRVGCLIPHLPKHPSAR